MSSVHPTAILEGDVDLADDVVIGPHCVLTGPVSLGAGTRLIGNVYLFGPLVAGSDNLIYPFACLGFAPQHTASDPRTSGPGTIGQCKTKCEARRPSLSDRYWTILWGQPLRSSYRLRTRSTGI